MRPALGKNLAPTVLALVFVANPAAAQTGVSDDRVSLADGPGARGGLGDDVSVSGNMGLAGYTVPVSVPAGFPGVTPSLALTYSSGAGLGVVGIGWTLPMPSVERMTSRGVPRYTLDDDLIADGAGELVRIPGTDPPVYRARFEGSFIRYTWQDAGDGTQGYFKAEYPNGNVGYFGATHEGALVPSARVAGPSGTFRYHLVDLVDVFEHRLTHTYTRAAGEHALLTGLAWVHNDAGVAKYSVALRYEARQDILSDGKPGFELTLRQRLRDITVFNGATTLRTATLAYENYADNGGMTRLVGVSQTGLDGAVDPLAFTFAYSRALGGVCSGAGCQEPFIRSLGSLGGGLGAGNATLIDINGDALPDLLETPLTGNHTFRTSQLSAAGVHTFSAAVPSTVASSSRLSSAATVVVDLNGDGFSDLINTFNGQVLYNTGVGDWVSPQELDQVTDVLPDLTLDDAEPGPRTIQFLDYDNDKRIDVIQSRGLTTTIWRNAGELGFVADPSVQNIGRGFDEGLQMADVNGDNMMDPVLLTQSQLSYRLNLGLGQWGPWVDILDLGLSASDVLNAEVEDINADGMADLVVVSGNEVRFALNRSGSSFAPFVSVTSASGGSIPDRQTNTAVLFADMNGNGSADVVWVEANGTASYLELFPIRPNLITRIENGLGAVTELTYATAVEQMNQSITPWTTRIPHSMIVVSRRDEFEGVSNLHDVTSFTYRDAYYDGVEKQFRGFGEVQQTREPEASQEGGLSVTRYNLGQTDRYLAGLEVFSSERSGTRDISETTSVYSDCSLDGIPTSGLKFPIRFVCPTLETTLLKEGASADQWVTTQTAKTYDGYGNVTLEEARGVTLVGGTVCNACAGGPDQFGVPCGATCLGDERFTETTYVLPTQTGGRWILGAPVRVKSYGTASSTAYQEDTFFYDGPDFVGLPAGQLTRGMMTRSAERVQPDASTTVDVVKKALDVHGNPTQILDSLGTPAGDTHRTTLTYDSTGLRLTRMEQHLVDTAGVPYRLRKEFTYDAVQDTPAETTDWMLVEGDTVRSPRNSVLYAMDKLGRLAAVARPGGDDLASPTAAYSYTHGNPVTQVVVTKRSRTGSAMDLEQVECLDGFGRKFQTRTRVAAGRYLVSGHTVFNKQSAAVKEYQPWESTSPACDTTPDTSAPFLERRYDALDRVLSVVEPDAALAGGTASRRTREYGPLLVRTLDEEDNDAASPRANTPTETRFNGRGEKVAETVMPAPGIRETTLLHYNEHGMSTGFTDASGHRKSQEMDLRGRITRVVDGDEGTSTMTYDDMGNVLTRTDGRGITQVYTYDGSNRLVSMAQQGQEAATKITQFYDVASGCPATQCTNLPGRLSRITHPLHGQTADLRRGYDPQGRAIYQARTLEGFLFEYNATVDNLGRVVSAVYPKGRQLEFSYDGASRLTSIPGHLSSITYDTRGRLSQVQFANGVTTTKTYDVRSRISGISAQGSAPVMARTFTLDRRGRTTAVQDTQAGAQDISGNAAFSYDARGRLTLAHLDQGRAAAEAIALGYHPNNTIASQTSDRAGSPTNLGTYTYAAGSRAVTAAGGLTLEYDGGGYLKRRGADAFSWDTFGRLASVQRGTTTVATYGYGAGSERLFKEESGSTTLYPFGDYEVRDGVGSIWITLRSDVVAKVEALELATDLLSDVGPANVSGSSATPVPDGAITVADAWVAQAAQAGAYNLPGSVVASPVRALLASSVRRLLTGTEPVATYFHNDQRHTPLAATDAAGAVTMRVEHFPFGAQRWVMGGTPEDQRFTGKEVDSSTGLVFFGARYLDPVLGRWISPDPLFGAFGPAGANHLEESTSGYAYVRNDPVGHVDPNGMFTFRASPEKKAMKLAKKQFDAAAKQAKKMDRAMDKVTQRFETKGEAMTLEFRDSWAKAQFDVRQAREAYSKSLYKLAATKSGKQAQKLTRKAQQHDSKILLKKQIEALKAHAKNKPKPAESREAPMTRNLNSTSETARSSTSEPHYNNMNEPTQMGSDMGEPIYNNVGDEPIYNNVDMDFSEPIYNNVDSFDDEPIYNNVL